MYSLKDKNPKDSFEWGYKKCKRILVEKGISKAQLFLDNRKKIWEKTKNYSDKKAYDGGKQALKEARTKILNTEEYDNFINKYKNDLDSKKSLCSLVNELSDIGTLLEDVKNGYSEVNISIHKNNSNIKAIQKKLESANLAEDVSLSIFVHTSENHQEVLRALSKSCLYKNSFWRYNGAICKETEGEAAKLAPLVRSKIGILTVGWKRQKLTRKYCESIALLRSSLKDEAEILPVFVDSEGHNKDSCREYSIPYFDYANRPLSNKFNYAMQYYKDKGVDGVIVMGTDNFLSEDLLREYVKASRNNFDLVGVLDSYIYNNLDDKMYHFKGYRYVRVGETLGAGRFLSSRLLKKMDFTPWGPGLNRNLDGSMWRKLKQLKFKEHKIQVKENAFMLLGVKTDVFLTDVNSISAKDIAEKEYIKKINVFRDKEIIKGDLV